MAHYHRSLAYALCAEIANYNETYGIQYLRFYKGQVPHNPQISNRFDLLAEIELPPWWPWASSNGYITLEIELDGTITAGGKCTWFQLVGTQYGSDIPLITGKVDVPGKPADIHLSSNEFYNGDPIKITSMIIYPLRLTATD